MIRIDLSRRIGYLSISFRCFPQIKDDGEEEMKWYGLCERDEYEGGEGGNDKREARKRHTLT